MQAEVTEVGQVGIGTIIKGVNLPIFVSILYKLICVNFA